MKTSINIFIFIIRINKKYLEKQTKRDKRIAFICGWLVYSCVGICTGLIAFALHEGVTVVSNIRFNPARSMILKDQKFLAYLYFTAISMLCISIPVTLVVFVEPAAAGSGIPEIKSYLNGTNIPKILRFRTLAVKVIGLWMSIAGGLIGGKEGPMVHTGAALAGIISHLPKLPKILHNESLKKYRNDHDKRDFVSGGAAAGVAAAFGAPLGGVLFSLEEASSFWSLPLTWRVFFGAMCSTYTLNLLLMIEKGDSNMNSPGLITFGTFASDGYKIWEIPIFILMGVGGGILGSCWNALNIKIQKFRRIYIHKRKLFKVFEVLIIGFITITIQFWIPNFFNNSCAKIPEESDIVEYYRRYSCEEGYYNPLATLIFTPLEQSIKGMFHNTDIMNWKALLIYFFIIYILAVITFGISVPAGLFVPTILMGSAYGRLIGQFLMGLFPDSEIKAGTYALIGSTALLGGTTRMTISLTVILLETTNNIEYLLPIMLVLMISKWVGDFLNISIYDQTIELRKIPFVEATPPKHLAMLTVYIYIYIYIME